MNISVNSMMLGVVGTNCYIVSNDDTKEAVVIDPGDEAEKVNDFLKKNGLTPKAVLLTHGHFDHIMGVDGVRDAWQVPVYVSEPEKALMEDPLLNGCGMIGRSVSVKADKFLKDKEEVAFGGMLFEVIYTPGHTGGGVCYYMPQTELLFSGDTLFQGSVGRTDLPTGSMSTLVRSIKERLVNLPEDTKVLPGHGPSSTIGEEKKYNPYL